MFYCCILYFYSILVSSEIESVSVWSESFRSRLFCTIIQLTHVARNNVIDALTSYVGIASQAWIHSDKDKVFTFLKTCPLSIIPYMECSRSHWREETFPKNQHTTNTMVPRWWKEKTTTKTTKNICDDCALSHLIYLFPIKEFNPSQLLNLDVRKVIKNIMNVFSNSPDKNRGNTKRGSYLKRKGWNVWETSNVLDEEPW